MNQGFYVQNYRPGDRYFWGPFILGGITGGLVSPLFYNNNRPYYPYPIYGPYPYYPYRSN